MRTSGYTKKLFTLFSVSKELTIFAPNFKENPLITVLYSGFIFRVKME